MILKKWVLIKLIIFFSIYIICEFYISYFKDYIDLGQSMNIDGYTRILLSDTFGYLAPLGFESPIEAILNSDIKNSIIPSALWYLALGNWHLMLVINLTILVIIANVLEKIGGVLVISEEKIHTLIALFLLSPSTLYYCIGSCKELVMTLLLLFVFYFYIKDMKKKLLMVLIFLVILRYQMIIIIILTALIMPFPKKML